MIFYCIITKTLNMSRAKYIDKNNKHIRVVKNYPPPVQIQCFITSQCTFNRSRQLILNNEYVKLHNDMMELENIRRSIMGTRCKEPTQINAKVIHEIENAQGQIDIPQFLLSSVILPTHDRFVSETWYLIYRAMHPYKIQISYTLKSFTSLLSVLTNMLLSEVAVHHECLKQKSKDTYEKEIKKLDKHEANYEKMCNEILQRCDESFFGEYVKRQDDNVWSHIDYFRDYMNSHTIDNFNDININIIWSVVTVTPFIIHIPHFVEDIITNPHSLYIEDVDLYPEDYYWNLIKQLRNRFYATYPNYTNEKCSEQEFDDWKIINMYSEIILKIIAFKNSTHNALDVISFDCSVRNIIRTMETKFVPFVGPIGNAVYMTMNLEPLNGTKRIHMALNKLLPSKRLEIQKMLTQLYPAENVITICIKCALDHKYLYMNYIDVLNDIAHGHEELITEIMTTKIKNPKTEEYLNLYAGLRYANLIITNETIEEEITRILNTSNEPDYITYLLSAFIMLRKYNIPVFKTISSFLIQTCETLIHSEAFKKGEYRFTLIDSVEHIHKHSTEEIINL